MKIFLEQAIFVNRAPFDDIDLSFSENEIALLSAINGSGKTTILSHIVDAFHEMARLHFPLSYEGMENKYYRVSSASFTKNVAIPSIVYLRFRVNETLLIGDQETPNSTKVDYLDIRGSCTPEQYESAIKLGDDKIQYNHFSNLLKTNGNVKIFSPSLNADMAKKIYSKNILTFFPAYRYETPGYLNDPYKIKLEFTTSGGFAGYLPNPIDVESCLKDIANWILDVVVDEAVDPTNPFSNASHNYLNLVITLTLSSKNLGNLRVAIAPRQHGANRIQIYENIPNETGKVIYPSLFNLSSGEAALLCIFGELLRQTDRLANIFSNSVTGIVLIDEVDKHLHIKLQKEILPLLLNIFPNVQFILSSHSPFLGMGLAEQNQERSKIIDLDNSGLATTPRNNDLFNEVFEMMLGENKNFKILHDELLSKINENQKPLIITEGKTDVVHLKKAFEKLNFTEYELDFFDAPDNFGSTKLNALLDNLSKLPQPRKIIGIYDRDEPEVINKIEVNNNEYKDYGNNVFAFCIPSPPHRNSYQNISIEMFYKEEHLKKEFNNKAL